MASSFSFSGCLNRISFLISFLAELSQEYVLQIFRFSCSQHFQILCLFPTFSFTIADSNKSYPLTIQCHPFLCWQLSVITCHIDLWAFLSVILCFSVPATLFLLMRTKTVKNSPPKPLPIYFLSSLFVSFIWHWPYSVLYYSNLWTCLNLFLRYWTPWRQGLWICCLRITCHVCHKDFFITFKLYLQMKNLLLIIMFFKYSLHVNFL